MKTMARPIALFCTIMTSTQAVAPAGAAEAAFFEPWEGRLVDDADDLLSWIAAQPWSSGRVAMVGGSYPGHTQLAGLRSANPALVACAPSEKAPDPATTRLLRGPSHLLLPTIPPPVRD